eukprot:m.212312 g.212312  ORF g.212312 m.212312 type:complete len:73 (-) comp25526_c0_seq2:603-821(-)
MRCVQSLDDRKRSYPYLAELSPTLTLELELELSFFLFDSISLFCRLRAMCVLRSRWSCQVSPSLRWWNHYVA